MSSHSRITKQPDSGALGGGFAGGSPPSSSPDRLSESGGTSVSSSQAANSLLDVSPSVSGASGGGSVFCEPEGGPLRVLSVIFCPLLGPEMFRVLLGYLLFLVLRSL